MAKHVIPRVLILSCSLLLGLRADAQPKLDKSSQLGIVGKLAEVVEARYVFPDKGKAIAEALRERSSRGEYNEAMSGSAFAALVTRHLQEISKDKHMKLFCRAAPLPRQSEPDRVAQGGFGGGQTSFGKYSRLPGNIGYYEIDGFMNATPEVTADIAEAMSELADTDALIFDVRKNGGGDPETVALVSSYLFEQRTHLNDLYWREGNRTDEYWTRTDVKGKKFGQHKEVYVLTGRDTFSAAEEFSYNLKSLGRAVIVGATTGGGAHPGAFVRLHPNCDAFISTGRAINPVTKTNWEGTGVVPDVAVDEAVALDRAQIIILNKKLATATDPKEREALRRRLAELMQ